MFCFGFYGKGRSMHILAIETSCDETAVAVVEVRPDGACTLAARVYSQLAEHAPYMGVVPEIASRAHLERLPQLVDEVLAEYGQGFAGLAAIAATTGPGLTTALAIGAAYAKTLALGAGLPFVPVNHIEGHALSPMLADADLKPPYLLFLLTGGHSQLVMVKDVGQYELLGATLDDAVGECFDKVGKLLGLPHPAGPMVETLAAQGTAGMVPLPKPLYDTSLTLSFSGLKTAVREAVQGGLYQPADIAASFQANVAAVLAKKCANALKQTGAATCVVAGGVAANGAIRAALQAACAEHGARFTAPPLKLCTDNAEMIALAAGLRLLHGLVPQNALAAAVLPRWPLESLSGSNG